MRKALLSRRYGTVFHQVRFGILWAFGLLCLCGVGPLAVTVAAARGGKATAAASALERGLQALTAKDLATASRLLSEAYRSTPRTELLYHLGRLAVAEGRVLDAHDLYRRYLADPARDPDEAATQAAEQFVSQPPPACGTVAVQSDPGAFVLVDQRLVGTLPLLLPLYLSPGDHTITLDFGNQKLEAPVPVAVGRLTEVRLSRSGAVVVSVIPAILLYSELTGVTAADARNFTDTTEQAARGEQYTLLSADLAVEQAAELKDCLKQESCQRQLAVKNKSNFVLQERLSKQGDAKSPTATWQLELRLLRVDVESPAGVNKITCAACTLETAAARLKEAAGKLLGEGLHRPRGTLQVTTEPAAATLRIGEESPVQAPYRATLWSGSYELRISLPGFTAEHRTVEVPDGKPLEVKVELSKDRVAEPVAPPVRIKVRPPIPKWRLAIGGVMIGVGIGMAVVGGIGLANNGACETSPIDPNDTCPTLHKTAAVGGFALGSGLLLIGSGGLLLGVKEPLRDAVGK